MLKNDYSIKKSSNFKLLLGVLLASAVFFIIVSVGVVTGALSGFDNEVGTFIRGFASDKATKLFLIITMLGKIQVLIGIMIVAMGFLLINRKIKSAVIIFIALGGAALFQDILKNIFKRPRPDVVHLVEAVGYSFPSAHTMMSTAFYWVLGYVIWKHLRNSSKKSWYIPILTSIIIIAIAISRVYLGAHYPSDVLGSILAGGFLANFFILAGKYVNIAD